MAQFKNPSSSLLGGALNFGKLQNSAAELGLKIDTYVGEKLGITPAQARNLDISLAKKLTGGLAIVAAELGLKAIGVSSEGVVAVQQLTGVAAGAYSAATTGNQIAENRIDKKGADFDQQMKDRNPSTQYKLRAQTFKPA